MKNIDYNKYIWEGWTVQDFIEALEWEREQLKNDIK